ncbi:MAG TPA: hypothetical protein VE825_04955 [Terriglobales bacterium]|jgi:hypothetical protein|nr:hypothetical protein [Terriglobales bacterium]
MTDPGYPENAAGDLQSSQSLTAKAKTYAARMRLQGTLDQADALEAIREVAANLIGCEEVALYKVDEVKAALWLYWSFGIDPNKYFCFDVLKEPRLREAVAGEIVFRGSKADENLLAIDDSVNALIPIRREGSIVGLLIFFRLLPQKAGLESSDREVCEMLSHWGGRAITPYQV